MPDLPYDVLFDLLGVHALGWLIAAGEGVIIWLLVKYIISMQEKYLDGERERTDKLSKVIDANTATITKLETVFDERTNAMLDQMTSSRRRR